MRPASKKYRSMIRWLLIAICGVAAAVFLFAWSGIYNVAASSGHWAIVEAFLRFGMQNSVALRARTVVPPSNLGSKDLIQLGAAHYERGCAVCHGSPIGTGNRVTEAMLPTPPNLMASPRAWSDAELFWIKYTGMPGWLAIERADEVWPVVAFLRALPAMSPAQYRLLAVGPEAQGLSDERQLDKERSPLRTCASCHGAGEVLPRSALVPRLHGQAQAFLAKALREYAVGSRPSGIMQPIAAALAEAEIVSLAEYYAGISSTAAAHGTVDEAHAIRGEQLATRGDAANRIPACSSCHGPNRVETFPALERQSATYMAGQLRLWRSGHNAATDGAAVMAPIARRLSDRDISAVTSYYAQQAPNIAAEKRQ
jgi:cytochrome c553